MELTLANYHSQAANQIWMSSHQFSGFMECPAQARAAIDGTYDRGTAKALLEGSYVDLSILTPDALPQWLEDNNEDLCRHGLIKKKGGFNADMAYMDEGIAHFRKQDEMMASVTGPAQVIMTGEIGGLPWKIAIDCVPDEGTITDLKKVGRMEGGWVTVAQDDCKQTWRPSILDKIAERTPKEDEPSRVRMRNTAVPWFEVYNYPRQLALYAEVYQQNTGIVPFVQLAAMFPSKASSLPDCRLVQFDVTDWSQRFRAEVDRTIGLTKYVHAWKTGPAEACPRCEECDYCALTRTRFAEKADNVFRHMTLV